jgi:histidinol-phosphate aminotransferase
MGLIDYYRQFEGLSEQEVNARKRAVSEERRRRELQRVEPLDLSQTTWPTLPHPYVVNAVTFAARRGLHRYPAPGADPLRAELAHRHELPPERVVVGNGAAQLLSAAAALLLAPGQELITPWPSYPLFPLMGRRARAETVPVETEDVDAILSAVTERTRAVALASPNDPSGRLYDVDALRRLLTALPEDVALLLDEALIDYADSRAIDASLDLLEDHRGLLVFRSFSKARGLAGLRCGYALGGPGSEELLAALAPDLGVNELVAAGILESLRSEQRHLERRVRGLAQERDRLTTQLRERGLDVPASQANFVWLGHPELDGSALADALARTGILVASGAQLGARSRVRITVRDAAASARLLAALDALQGSGAPPQTG